MSVACRSSFKIIVSSRAMVPSDNAFRSPALYPGVYKSLPEWHHNHANDDGPGPNLFVNTAAFGKDKNVEDIAYSIDKAPIQNDELNAISGNSVNTALPKGFKLDVPPPPKRPLTPYMRFSKYMWQQVKSDNPGLSVCEIGSTIGRMWRELSTADKQKHNDDFTLDKVRYDTELKQYLKDNGLKSRDLVKFRTKNRTSNKGACKSLPSPPNLLKMKYHLEPNAPEPHSGTSSQFGQSLFPIGTPLNMPMGMLCGLSHMWMRHQYPSHQILANRNLAQTQDVHSADVFYGSPLTPSINFHSPNYF